MATSTVSSKTHPDCHMPPEIEVGRGFDGSAYAERVRAAGAGAAVIFAKCHYGLAYYPTRIGTPHPRLAVDLVGASVAGLRRRGLRSVVYFSVFLDSAAAAAHPDWALVGASGTAAGFDSGKFRALCVNSPYADELFIPMCAEVLRDYAPDELFFDTMTGFHPCGCARCVRAFGGPIPAAGDAAWLSYVRWYARCFDGFFERVTVALRALAPVEISWNWKWAWTEGTLPLRGAGLRLAADLIASPAIASLHSRYFAGSGMPFDYMCGRFAHGLDEWNNNSRESLATTAAVTAAHGGGFWLIDRFLPDCTLEERGWRALREVSTELAARQPWTMEATHVAETAILCSAAHLVGDDLRWFPDPEARKTRSRPIEAAARLFGVNGRHSALLGRERLLERLDDYRLVVLPDTEDLDATLLDRLGAWVERGGALLATAPADGIGARLAELAGVTAAGWRDSTYGFIDADPDPLCVRACFARTTLAAGTEVVHAHRPPTVERFGHGLGPPAAIEGAAVTVRKLGGGAVALVAYPAFANAWMWPSLQIDALLLGLIDRLLPDPIVRVGHPAAIEAVARRRGDDLIVHLVNRSGREEHATWWYPTCRHVPTLERIVVTVPRRAGTQVAIRQPAGERLAIATSARSLTITLPRLDLWEIIELPGYFAGERA